jgi:hypothetical protein
VIGSYRDTDGGRYDLVVRETAGGDWHVLDTCAEDARVIDALAGDEDGRPQAEAIARDWRARPGALRAPQLVVLDDQTGGLVELAAGARRDGRQQITTRRRADHFLPGGRPAGESGCGRCSRSPRRSRRGGLRRTRRPLGGARQEARGQRNPLPVGPTSMSPASCTPSGRSSSTSSRPKSPASSSGTAAGAER